MTDTRWSRIEQLFDQAADLAAEEQHVLLARECGEDAALRDAVQALLDHDRSHGSKIAAVVEAVAGLPAPEERSFTGHRFGPYRIVRELGRGGMGIVFEAVRDDGTFTKQVALKVATRAVYSPEFMYRFRDERQILARLEHPHIARLLDGGTAEDGIPYFAMEFVEGVPIHKYVAGHELDLSGRLRLFLQVCDAVDYAHQNLVVHRDLTPRNILVADGSVKLLDFGISKLLDATDGGVTAPGLVPFTPDYGSPEQVRGQAVTTRTDVYALGLVLFEILTGVRAQQVATSSPGAFERAICETPVPAPSASAHSRGDRALGRRLRGDLDTIVLTATEKDPGRRYVSAAALADDVRRHMESKPIGARQASAWYKASRFTRRHWRPIAAASLLAIALAAGVISTRAEARRAERRFEEVRRIANTLMTDIHAAIRDLPASSKAQELVVATAVQYLEGLTRESGDDPALLAEVGLGYTKVAELAFSLSRPSLGRPEDARRYLDQAAAVLTPLHASHPDDAGVSTAMATLQSVAGSFLFETGRAADALQSIETAIQTGEAALARHPAHLPLLELLVEARGNLLARFEGNPAAPRHIARYLELAERLAREQPAAVTSQAALGVAYSQAGKVAASADRLDEALGYFRRNAEIQGEIVAADPYNATARRNLMLAWSTLADVALGPLGQTSYTGAGGPAVEIDAGRRRDALDAARRTIEEAERLYREDPENPTRIFDRAIALGRSAPAYPPGDEAAIGALEEGLALLRGLDARNAARAQPFLIELSGSLAERHRQTGRIDRALAAWRDTDAAFRLALDANPGSYYPRRLMIPVLQNWAMTLAAGGDPEGARRLAQRAVALADEVASSAEQYSRAPGWPPRVRAWLADLHESTGERDSAQAARSESRAMWTAVAAREDLPPDLMDEAKKALNGAAARF
jgi:serine/threonine protein kinase/tetratricopeptide (TPR) repeat protein